MMVSCNDYLHDHSVTDNVVSAVLERPDVLTTKGLDYSDRKLSFVWESGDQVMVYGSSTSFIFKVGEGGSDVTKLESPDFTLNNNVTYYKFSPVAGTLSEAPKTAINVSFDGQRQIANADTKHLRLNLYACATATVENNAVNFKFKNQVSWVRYSHTFGEAVAGAKTVTLSVSDGKPFVLVGTLDATNAVSEKGLTTSITATKYSSEITLDLGDESTNGIDIEKEGVLNAFFTIHPVDLTGKTVKFTVKSANGEILASNEFIGSAINRNAFVQFTDESAEPGEKTVATINDVAYTSIKDAIDNVPEGGTIKLVSDVDDEAIFVAKGEKNFTFDLDGHTFTATEPLAGSTGTKNQALHLEAGNTITIKNGTIKAIDGIKIWSIIQNYANLTLDDVIIDAANLNYNGIACYAISNNCGNVLLKGNTSIINVPEGAIAMDVCKFASYEKPTVTVSTIGTINGTIELSGGDLVLGADLKITKPIIGNYEGISDINLDGHTLTAPKIAILNDGKATLTIHDGNIVSEGYIGVMVNSNTNTTITSCNITGLEGAVGTGLATGATVNISGGIYTATDNAVIAGNGSKRDGEANIITIEGGTFKGQITTKGYIACGIYAPWKDIITVNGGDFEITNGVGVLCRGGQVNINGGTFSTTGDGTGWVGDDKNQIACKTLVLDTDAKYPEWESAKISATAGTFSDDACKAFVADGHEVNQEGSTFKVNESKVTSVANQEELNSAITGAAKGKSAIVALSANSTFTLNSGIAHEGNNSRNITFVGDETQTIDVITNAVKAEGGMLNYQRGSSFTFKNMTIQAGKGDFDGIVCDEQTYKNCTIKGKLTLYGKATFIDCTFENDMENQYSIWTWGGTDVKFEGCTFNTNGKAILLYGGTSNKKPTNLIVTDCIFNDSEKKVVEKAAIEIGDSYGSTYSLVATKCTVNGFAINPEGPNTNSTLWANKNNMDAEHLSVTIDGKKVL